MSAPPERFANEQAEAQHWLGILKDGPNHRKIEARLGLARIFEARGMPAEATELLVTCIGAGHRDPETYEWLARLHAAQGRPELSVRARAEARQLRVQAAAALVSARPAAEWSLRPHRRGRAALYLVAGIVVAVGGYTGATMFGDGVLVILYALPVFGVALTLRGLAGLFPRSVSR